MRIRTHLIAMPWSPPDTPSIQLGSLKAHLDRALHRRADCRAYSAFFSILHELEGSAFQELFRATATYGEYVYQTLYLRRFKPAALRAGRRPLRPRRAGRGGLPAPFSLPVLHGLERATRSYLDGRVGPALIARGLNVVGFTLNYDQVYASLYAAEHLRRRFPDRHFLFVYGGCSASLPNVYALLCELQVPGVVVVGEGERKLELLVRALAELPPARARTASATVAGLDPGVIAIGEEVDLGSRNPAQHATQLESLDELAVPDYDEYFAALRQACADERTYAACRAATDLFVEGSRGCFAHCDFCAMNRSWHGFRKRTAGQVVDSTLALTRRYRSSRVVFADNVCDTWAREYARMLLRAGIRQQSLMELRAHHPEEFWISLALAGVESIQVGVEALSAPLLKAMGKGATLVQNLTAQKVLSELGIQSNNQLITHHPASTLADVRETRRILRQVPHWGTFRPVRFQLMAGSPLYERLSPAERAALRPTRSVPVRGRAAHYALEFSYQLPKALDPGRRVMRAWSAFQREHERATARHQARRPRLEVVRVAPDTLRITDTRDGGPRLTEISGEHARVHDACHRGLKLEAIALATGLPGPIVQAHLARLLRSGLVLRVQDCYLSLAMRPRDELLRRLLVAPADRPRLAAPGEERPG